ncbi:MAG TPA: DUF1194 domain-containing protein [Azospirillum sp.]
MATRPLAVLLLVLALALAGRAWGADAPVDLELVLAVDVSGSVDEEEAQLQRLGYVEAFQNAKVADAIRSGPYGRIAVTYIEWAGEHYQRTVVDWMVLDGAGAPRAFADTLAMAPIGRERWTAIGAAIEFCAPRFDGNGFEGTRKVIDISGDGPNNNGPPVEWARDAALARGITINGLPIVNDRPNPWGGEAPRDLDAYYRNRVIGGPGAFIVVAQDFGAFALAILNKLLLEIAGARPDGAPPAASPRHAFAACPGCGDLP